MFDDKKILRIANSIPGRQGIAVERDDETVLMDYNSDEIFPSASTIKLFILWSVYKKINDGLLNKNELIPINDTPRVVGCGILQNLATPDLELTVSDIANLMIVLSDNVATNLMIDLAGMDYINSEIKKYGFNKTKLERHMMDGDARERGLDNYTTASEQIKILKNIERHEDISLDLRNDMLEMLSNQILTDHAGQYLPLDYKFAHKTGNLAATLHDTGILTTPKGKYYISILTDDLEDIVEGKKVMNLLSEEIFNQIRLYEDK
ncbi:MAG: serine hydrolase [Tissierellia bacterium]|nr:serine hydrolase [Tissierellia bacterium]